MSGDGNTAATPIGADLPRLRTRQLSATRLPHNGARAGSTNTAARCPVSGETTDRSERPSRRVSPRKFRQLGAGQLAGGQLAARTVGHRRCTCSPRWATHDAVLDLYHLHRPTAARAAPGVDTELVILRVAPTILLNTNFSIIAEWRAVRAWALTPRHDIRLARRSRWNGSAKSAQPAGAAAGHR